MKKKNVELKNNKKAKSPNIFVRWYKLTQPNKWFWFLQILFFVGFTSLCVVQTVFAAKIITSMFNNQWNLAFLNLGLELLIIIISNVSYHLEYIFYGKQIKTIRVNVFKKVYNKIMSCENKSFDNLSKDKVLNISLNNTDSVANFLAYGVQVVITLVVVYFSNIWAGIIVTLLGVVNFFVYYTFNKKMGKVLLDRHEKKESIFSSLNKIIDGKAVINELEGR